MRTMRPSRVLLGVPVLAAALATPAFALDPAVKCEADKLKTAAKFASCRLNADAKAVKKATTADYTRCDQRLAEKWARIEAAAGGACPPGADLATVQGTLAMCTDDVPGGPVACGSTLYPTCGGACDPGFACVPFLQDCDISPACGSVCPLGVLPQTACLCVPDDQGCAMGSSGVEVGACSAGEVCQFFCEAGFFIPPGCGPPP